MLNNNFKSLSEIQKFSAMQEKLFLLVIQKINWNKPDLSRFAAAYFCQQRVYMLKHSNAALFRH